MKAFFLQYNSILPELMKRIIYFFSILALCQFNASCQSNGPSKAEQSENMQRLAALQNNFDVAYFASGCFWCVEAIYERLDGVEAVISGYSGGHTQNPTYDSSNTGLTGHAESVMVFYQSGKISFQQLLEVYFASQNISQFNGQGPDNGPQYRSILFYKTAEEKELIDQKIKALEAELGKGRVAAEVLLFEKFWIGEDYHQDYEQKHPNHPYIQNISVPRLQRVQAKLPALFKQH